MVNGAKKLFFWAVFSISCASLYAYHYSPYLFTLFLICLSGICSGNLANYFLSPPSLSQEDQIFLKKFFFLDTFGIVFLFLLILDMGADETIIVIYLFFNFFLFILSYTFKPFAELIDFVHYLIALSLIPFLCCHFFTKICCILLTTYNVNTMFALQIMLSFILTYFSIFF